MALQNPKHMAIILLLSAAIIFSVSTATNLPQPPAPPPEKPNPIEECVKLRFDPHASASSWKSTLCRDLLRMTVRSFQITGNLSPEYLTALKVLPSFKNNPATLKNFLCGLRPAKKATDKFGCNKVVIQPTVN